MSSRLMHGVVLTTASVAAAAALAACGNSPSGTPTEPVSTSSAATSATTAPAWQAQYTPAQIAAYDAALVRWKAYRTALDEALAAGADTPGAEATFREYTAIAPALIAQLRSLQSQGIQVTTPPKPLWVKASRISGTNSLTLQECDDLAVEMQTKNGSPMQLRPKTRYGLTTVDMSRPQGKWLIYSASGSDTPCSPTL